MFFSVFGQTPKHVFLSVFLRGAVLFLPSRAAMSRAWARDVLAWQWGVGKDESLVDAWGVALPKLLVHPLHCLGFCGNFAQGLLARTLAPP